MFLRQNTIFPVLSSETEEYLRRGCDSSPPIQSCLVPDATWGSTEEPNSEGDQMGGAVLCSLHFKTAPSIPKFHSNLVPPPYAIKVARLV